MMQTNSQLIDQYSSLPLNLQRVLVSESTREKVRDIGLKHNLSVENISLLEGEVEIVLLGSNNPSNLDPILEKVLHTNPETVSEIVKEIDREIFSQVRDELNELYNDEDETVEDENKEKVEKIVEIEKDEDNDEKTRILKGIENPEKVPDDISLYKKPIQKNINDERVEDKKENIYVIGQDIKKVSPPENLPVEKNNTENFEKKENTIFEQKMNAFYEAEKKKDVEGNTKTDNKNKKDLYRESLD